MTYTAQCATSTMQRNVPLNHTVACLSTPRCVCIHHTLQRRRSPPALATPGARDRRAARAPGSGAQPHRSLHPVPITAIRITKVFPGSASLRFTRSAFWWRYQGRTHRVCFWNLQVRVMETRGMICDDLRVPTTSHSERTHCIMCAACLRRR